MTTTEAKDEVFRLLLAPLRFGSCWEVTVAETTALGSKVSLGHVYGAEVEVCTRWDKKDYGWQSNVIDFLCHHRPVL